MHELEPYHRWREHYVSEEDEWSPFFGMEYSEFEYTNKVYNYFLHPQWDDFGSNTLFLKILCADYDNGFAVIEFIGEWNDCIENDIMFLKRDIIDQLIGKGINHFILIGENVLNFHCSDDCYYEEWFDDVKEEGGWIACINFRDHALTEMEAGNLKYYLNMGGQLNNLLWRKLKPLELFTLVDNLIIKALV